ncbi:hypothetical protein B0H10DRAFT_1826275 [Mycena sp. CBHHK59/15]|nr:hypothetical protein B0H10DRAFT_1826275 [Mycena sp. CBHHK59/15]
MPPKPVATARHESRPKTKAPLPTVERLKRLFTTLCAQIDGGHHPNAIRTCDKILRIAPDDADARQTKLFLLLTTDQPAAALALIDADADAVETSHAFERAYALYCLQQKDAARAALGADDSRGARHLEAQLSHRAGVYADACDVYNALLDSAPTAEEHADILTNIQAASAHLDFITTGFLHSLDALTPTPLEAMPPPSGAAPYVAPATQVKATEPETTKLSKKVRLPRGVVLGVTPPPDPERWLKKSERAGFGARRRKGGGGGGGGATQGSAADVPDAGKAASGGGGGKAKGKKRK